VTRFPLDMMGKGSFKDITPDKIHTFWTKLKRARPIFLVYSNA
jgi:hypothetical protein